MQIYEMLIPLSHIWFHFKIKVKFYKSNKYIKNKDNLCSYGKNEYKIRYLHIQHLPQL